MSIWDQDLDPKVVDALVEERQRTMPRCGRCLWLTATEITNKSALYTRVLFHCSHHLQRDARSKGPDSYACDHWIEGPGEEYFTVRLTMDVPHNG